MKKDASTDMMQSSNAVETARTHGGLALPAGVASHPTAFDDIYVSYLPLLRRIAIRKFGIPREDVDALVHDVFATYLTHSERVREIHPYLIGGICNAARQYWRQSHAESAVFCRDDHSRAAHEPEVSTIFRNLLLSSVLAKLGDSCRDALYRFYICGESAISIAASRGTTQNSILRLLNYCRGRAREAYRVLSGRTHA